MLKTALKLTPASGLCDLSTELTHHHDERNRTTRRTAFDPVDFVA